MSSSNFKKDGWYVPANHFPSPNVDARPASCQPELLVIHAISLPAGQFSDTHFYIDDLFLNRLDFTAHPDFEQLRGVHVSSHFLIRRNGDVIQFAAAEQRAWHAGVSQFMGREKCNDFSVGIELEGSDFTPFEAAQYNALIQLTGALLTQYPIHHIAGHEDIAPGRKTDPGPHFDWAYFENALRENFPAVFAKAVIGFRTGEK